VTRTVTQPASPSTTTASTTPSATTTTTAANPAAPAANLPALHLRAFRSPSSNLGCELDATVARCDIAQRTWKSPPRPASCQLDYGNGLEVLPSGTGRFTCAGDTALNPQDPPLPYGRRSTIGSLSCLSEPSGITCRNAAGHGFAIARTAYRIF
jgi:hypothetical protein